MGTFHQVEPIGRDREGEGRVFLHPAVMDREDVRTDDVVLIQTSTGRSAIARVGEPPDGIEEDHVRVGNALRSSLKVNVGERVEVEPYDVETLERVTFAPLSDVSGIDSDELAEYLKASFIERGRLVNAGSIEYVSLPGRETATGFKVIDSTPSGGIIDVGTNVDVDYAFETWGRSSEVTFEDIGGLDKELQEVRELVEYPLRFPDIYHEIGIKPARGVILFGPPGTGKTMMTRAISNEVDANFHYVNGPGIIGSGYGETEEKLEEVFLDARKALPSIVLIDELDAIAPKRDETGTFADLRVVTQLMELMDGLDSVEGVMVVATTNRLDEIEPALRRPGRFDRELFVGPPGRDGREEIFRIHTRGMLLEEGFSDRVSTIVGEMNGYTGADIRELVREAGVNALRRHLPSGRGTLERGDVSLTDVVVRYEDFTDALSTVQPSVLRGPLSHDSRVTMDDVGGLAEAKERLSELIEAPREHAAVFEEMNIRASHGILLTGPSGTGKTMLAQAAGHDFGVTFLSVDTSDIFSEWLGQSERSIKQLFSIARRAAPSLILIDNLDTVAGRRGGDERVTERVLNQLTVEMDSLQRSDVTVVATTDRPEVIDDTLRAPSRFGETIELGPPDAASRAEILSIHLRDTPSDVSDAELKEIAGKTDGWTGAELEALCNEAKMVAVREADYTATVPVGGRHLEAALERRTRNPGGREDQG